MEESISKLISFLMENFYIVIGFIGVIYSVFFRKSSIEKRPPQRMPDFGGNPVFPQRPKNPAAPPSHRGGPLVSEPSTSSPRSSPFDPPSSPASSPFPPPLRPTAAVEEDPVSGRAQWAYTVKSGNGSLESDLPSEKDSEPSLTREELSRAIVWAEILGPPRARKPFKR